MISRIAYQKLREWKELPSRKPLLIRGARQVGKTTLVREFAKEFDHFVELNLERDSDRAIFEMDDINMILNAAYLLKGIIVDSRPTLLFIDEIQESPQAIQKLRYFYEDRPDIYLIAAGSLLEFALRKVPSFPVGRVSYLYLSPICFDEFLMAIDNIPALEALNTIPLPNYAHSVLLNLFHEYTVIGGMPEVVSHYIANRNVSQLATIYKQLWQAYKDDAEKYSTNDTERRIIRHVIDSAPFEPDRIKFEGFGKSNYRSREVGEAVRSLDLAGIIRLIYPSTSLDPPIVTDLRKRPRLQFLDTGLLNNALNLQGDLLKESDMNNFHRGKISQHLVTQQLIAIEQTIRYNPHFWVREDKDSNSEVDLIYQYGSYVIPIEVKSGKQGRLRSLHQFMERAKHRFAIRLYAGMYSVEKVTTPNGTPYNLMNLPYSLATKIPQYIEYLIKNYNDDQF
ncbi:MAG TPA: AAA family ATPase [Tenuifilaceae bacterium]|nr:AAA family ATPase [Tenuifilaceae bacterium]